MPTYYLLSCQHCNSEFNVLPRNRNRKFCSSECSVLAKRKHHRESNCVNCGKELKRGQFKFCHRSCAALYNNKIRSKKSRESQQRSLIKTLHIKGKLRTDEKLIYWARCRFKFNPYKFKNITGYSLLLKYGIYHPVNNTEGVCRDHIFSIYDGWRLGMPANIISHPANCQFISNYDNSKKNSSSWITLIELIKRILNWERNIQMSPITAIDKINKTQVDKNDHKNKTNSLRFRYVIKNKISNEIYETTNITKWSEEQGFVKSTVYNSKNWIILEKYNLKTGEKLI